MISFYGNSLSFATHGWPSMLAKKLNMPLENFSRPAESITEAIFNLRKKESFGEVVCVTISTPERIYHPDYLIYKSLRKKNPRVMDKRPVMPKKIDIDTMKEAVNQYYTYIDNPENQEILYEMMINWMLTLTNNHPKTKFILIPAYKKPTLLQKEFNAVITYPCFIDVLLEMWSKNGGVDLGTNHFSIAQNKKIADMMYELIVNYDTYRSSIVKQDFFGLIS